MYDDTHTDQNKQPQSNPGQQVKADKKGKIGHDGDMKKLELEFGKLKQELDQLKQQLGETQQQRIRAMADYQNQEKRFEKEKQEFVKFANANLLLRILDVADNLDRAVSYINDPGLSMVQKDMQAMLKEFGVEEIPVLDKPFDPNIMECIDKTGGKVNIVLEVKEKGYQLQDRVLRPAKVVVGEDGK